VSPPLKLYLISQKFLPIANVAKKYESLFANYTFSGITASRKIPDHTSIVPSAQLYRRMIKDAKKFGSQYSFFQRTTNSTTQLTHWVRFLDKPTNPKLQRRLKILAFSPVGWAIFRFSQTFSDLKAVTFPTLFTLLLVAHSTD